MAIDNSSKKTKLEALEEAIPAILNKNKITNSLERMQIAEFYLRQIEGIEDSPVEVFDLSGFAYAKANDTCVLVAPIETEYQQQELYTKKFVLDNQVFHSVTNKKLKFGLLVYREKL